MTCADLRERLMDLLCGISSPEEAREMEAHLASCPACRVERERLLRQEAQLEAHFQGLRNGLASRVEARLPRPAPSRRPWRPLAAAAVLLVVTGLWFLRPGGQVARPRPMGISRS